MHSLVRAFFILSVSSLANASPAAFVDIEKRGCISDNCLRALKGHSSNASTYCSTYTTQTLTATTGFPTYIPSTCGPSRISSACSCLISTGITTTVSTLTTTSSNKPTITSSSTQTSTTRISSTSTSTGAASTCTSFTEGDSVNIRACEYVHNNYGTCNQGGPAGDPDCLNCSSAAISQNISWCPGVKYTFEAYAYCDRTYGYTTSYVPGNLYPAGGLITAYLDNVLVASPTPACPACPCSTNPVTNPNEDDPCADCWYNTSYNLISGHVTGSASGKGVLQVKISAGHYPTILDIIDLYSS